MRGATVPDEAAVDAQQVAKPSDGAAGDTSDDGAAGDVSVLEAPPKRERLLHLVARRLLRALLVAWGVSLLAFLIVRLVPGDPVLVMLGEEASPERIENFREELNLNGSVLSQYFGYTGDLLQGDLGKSFQTTRPVTETIFERLPITLWLNVLAMLLALLIAVPFGVIGGLTRSNVYKQGFNLFSAALIATPPFVTGVLFLLGFAVKLRWLPVAGYVRSFPQNLEYLILPSLATAIPISMIFAIVLQESIRETNAEEFVETGLVWGLPKRTLTWRYLLRPSIAPVIGLLGYIVGANMAAAVIVETVFNLEGIGTYLVRGVLARDYSVVQGTLFVFGLIVVVVHFLADSISAIIDPRARTIT